MNLYLGFYSGILTKIFFDGFFYFYFLLSSNVSCIAYICIINNESNPKARFVIEWGIRYRLNNICPC